MAESSASRKSYIPFSWLSIQQRLPLLICILLLSVGLVFGWLAEIGVRKAAMEMGTERLGELTRQLGTLFGQSALASITATRVAADAAKVYLVTLIARYQFAEPIGCRTPDAGDACGRVV